MATGAEEGLPRTIVSTIKEQARMETAVDLELLRHARTSLRKMLAVWCFSALIDELQRNMERLRCLFADDDRRRKTNRSVRRRGKFHGPNTLAPKGSVNLVQDSPWYPNGSIRLLKQVVVKDEHSNDPRRSGSSAISVTAQTTPVPVVHQLGEAGLEDQSGGGHDAVTGEHGLAKTDGMTMSSAAWFLASGASHHATGNRALLSSFVVEGDNGLAVLSADGEDMRVLGRGDVVAGDVLLRDVWYVPGLTSNVVSVGQLAEMGCCVGFGPGACDVTSISDGALLGKARLGEDGLFQLEFLKLHPAMDPPPPHAM